MFNRINGFVGVQNGKAKQPVWTWTANGANLQEACFARATQVWLAINHKISVTSGKWIQFSKRIAQENELGNCQSNFVSFMSLWKVVKF